GEHAIKITVTSELAKCVEFHIRCQSDAQRRHDHCRGELGGVEFTGLPRLSEAAEHRDEKQQQQDSQNRVVVVVVEHLWRVQQVGGSGKKLGGEKQSQEN